MIVLSDRTDPRWGAAFAFLSDHPDRVQITPESFRAVLEPMGVKPSGTDPATGTPVYGLADVARSMGVPKADLEEPPSASSRELIKCHRGT